MKNARLVLVVLFFSCCLDRPADEAPLDKMAKPTADKIRLPEPVYESETSVEEAILDRRSVREYGDEPLSLKEVSQILWSAQGVTDRSGLRAAPSAGAAYPLEVYLVAKNVEGLPSGVYRYLSNEHSIEKTLEGDYSEELAGSALDQGSISDAAINLVYAAVYNRTTRRYGERGVRYVHMEAGHASQNVYLQCQSLGLGTVAVGAFDDAKVKELLALKEEEEPLYIMPVGWI